jgi:hypothetical protein
LTTDDRALQFAPDHRDEVFSAAPVVFGGVYPDDAARMIEGKDKVTGVYQRMDIEGTLRTALAIQPNPQAVYVINELSESGHGTEREMERVVSAMLPGIEMVSLSQLSLDEIKQVVSTLNQTSILIIGSYGFDRDRAIHHPEVLAREVSRASAIPVHLLFSQGFGTGALGGSLLSGERQAKSPRDSPCASYRAKTCPPSGPCKIPASTFATTPRDPSVRHSHFAFPTRSEIRQSRGASWSCIASRRR